MDLFSICSIIIEKTLYAAVFPTLAAPVTVMLEITEVAAAFECYLFVFCTHILNFITLHFNYG